MKHFVPPIIMLALVGCVAAGPMHPVTTKLVQASSAPGEEAIRNHSGLFDPFSAQYRNQRVYVTSDGDRIYCGEVNAKNRMGGYVGFTPYYVRLTASGELPIVNNQNTIHIDYFAGAACRDAAAGQLNISG